MQPNEQDRPSAVLKAEHQVILRVLCVLDKLADRIEQGGEFPQKPLAQCVKFFRLFADACHHAKEEDLLFPVLESRGIPRDGGPIGVMLYEHQVARGLTRDMADALNAVGADAGAQSRFLRAARQYHELLTQHIFKEDNVLFNMGDRVLNPEDQSTMASRFCEVNCRVFEGKRREELSRIADDLESDCGDA
ncbi:MAG: hemerythrin [Phycisphaerales bacterium]|nr:hemerythrin [Phycisphaerales bacterium]